MNKPKITIEYAPGCFDNWEGTQEELDQVIAEFQQLVDNGELFDHMEIVDEDSNLLEMVLDIEQDTSTKRTLH